MKHRIVSGALCALSLTVAGSSFAAEKINIEHAFHHGGNPPSFGRDERFHFVIAKSNALTSLCSPSWKINVNNYSISANDCLSSSGTVASWGRASSHFVCFQRPL